MISVAMTTFNGEAFLRKQIASILQQSLPVDELVISDDGSVDDTRSLIEEAKNKLASRSKVTLLKNVEPFGYIENFYRAIRATHGDYIFLADQDDVWEFNKVEKLVSVLKMRPDVKLVCSNFVLIDEFDNPLPMNLDVPEFIKSAAPGINSVNSNQILYGNIAQGCTYCFTPEVRDLYLEIHNSEIIHDYQLMLISSLCYSVAFLNEPLIKYRIHHNNSVGFSKVGVRSHVKVHCPKVIPTVLKFINSVSKHRKIHNLWKIRLKLLFRLPVFRAWYHQMVRAQTGKHL